MGLTWKEKLELVKQLRIDIYVMLFFTSFSISGVSLNQLVEDKICLNYLKLNETICLNLEHNNDVQESDRNYILSTAAVFKNYQTILLTTPGIFLSLFVGYWIDAYPSHLKYILAAPAFMSTIGSVIVINNCLNFESDYMFLLLSELLRGLVGGFATLYTGIYTYITRKTPAKFRAIRFAILEFFSFIATPISLYLGGYLLTTEPMFVGQPRNYVAVFLVSAICSTLSGLWVIIFVRDSGSSDIPPDTEPQVSVIDDSDESKIVPPSQSDGGTNIGLERPHSNMCCGNFFSTISDIFNLTNVLNMFYTCTRKRKDGLRCRIWHSMVMASVVLLSYMGDSAIGFPFSQKVYHWDAAYYSNVSSATSIIPSIATSFLMPLLVKKYKLTDTALGVIGCISMIAGMIIRGGFLTPTAYFVAIFAGMLSGLAPIAIRAFLARMISFNEIGQVYSLLSAIESIAPAVSALFYSTIFKYTIGTYPGMVYQIAAVLLFYPLTTILWLDLTKASWYEANKVVLSDNQENGNPTNSEISTTNDNHGSLNTIGNDLEYLINV